MAEPGEGNPKRNEAIIVNDDPDAPSLLNPMNGEVFVTNRVGQRIMELADGSLDPGTILERILEQFKGAPEQTVRQDLEQFLTETTKRGLITWE